MFLLQFCGAGGLLLVISTDTQSPILQGRTAEIPYRKHVAMFNAKIMPFIYFQVCYLLWMCFPIMALHLCWFILLTLPDPLEADRAERRSHNSFRLVALMKSRGKNTPGLASGSAPPRAAILNSRPVEASPRLGRRASESRGRLRVRTRRLARGSAEGQAGGHRWKTASRASDVDVPAACQLCSAALGTSAPSPSLCSAIQEWAPEAHPLRAWGPLELLPSVCRKLEIQSVHLPTRQPGGDSPRPQHLLRSAADKSGAGGEEGTQWDPTWGKLSVESGIYFPMSPGNTLKLLTILKSLCGSQQTGTFRKKWDY